MRWIWWGTFRSNKWWPIILKLSHRCIHTMCINVLVLLIDCVLLNVHFRIFNWYRAYETITHFIKVCCLSTSIWHRNNVIKHSFYQVNTLTRTIYSIHLSNFKRHLLVCRLLIYLIKANIYWDISRVLKGFASSRSN